MQTKISKTLEGIIARVAFDTAKSAIHHSLKDFLTLEILRAEGSLAYQILSSRLKDWELYQIGLRIGRELAQAPAEGEPQQPEAFFTRYADELRRAFAPVRLSLIHI